MRTVHRSNPVVRSSSSIKTASLRAEGGARGSFGAGGEARGSMSIDLFVPAGKSVKGVVRSAAGAAAKSALSRVAEKALTSVLSRVFESVATKLARALERLLGRIGGGSRAPQLPSVTEAVASPSVMGPPAPAASTGLLPPTPLAKEVPGQVGYVNTIQEPRIAPRSQFRDVVNQSIDAVRARGQGIDPQDPDRITDYDTYHSAVVSELRSRGYNAAYDGEELAVGRKGDSFSEQFDISTSTGLVRRFYAAHLSPPVWA